MDRRAREILAGLQSHEIAIRYAPAVALAEAVSIPAHLHHQLHREGIDHRHSHTVEATGDFVPFAPELAPGVKSGHDDLNSRPAVPWHLLDRDTTPVVHHADRAIGQDRDAHDVTDPGQRLVHRVVHHLVDQVVQTAGSSRSDVHAWAFPHRLQAFEHLDITGVVCMLTHCD
jgi:hypothetical protein